MSYVKGQLSKVYDELESGITYWLYWTSDSLGAVQASGYFSDATDRRLKLGDVVDVFSGAAVAAASGAALGAVTFPATVGVSARFASAPQYMRMGVSAVAAATTTTPGAATVVPLEPTAASMLANFRNLVDGGDFTINPWQRGTTFSAIANTLTYTADRFFAVGGASSSISVSRQAQTDVLGFTKSLRWGRGGGTNTAVINLGQVVETADTIRAQGQQCTLSFWAKAGAQFSALGAALSVLVASGTGSDEGAAGLVAASWTGYSSLVLTPAQGTAAAAANVAQPLTTAPVRYAFSFTVPATATELGVLFNYAPTGTNNTTDTVDFYGVQLEIGGLTVFEHRDVQVELEIAQRYFYQINEPASGVIVGTGSVSASNVELFYLALPVQMRTAPTVTVTVGTFKSNSSTAGVVAATGLTGNATHTVNAVGLTSTGTGTAGQAAMLQGGGGSGVIAVSADL